ncbi:MAG: DUF192 domain-containing protein [Candidatus Berkelbacteria bacterium]|nr:DUF192 domain-containing protein [Candidatus Berkelbacteria bacterium]
MTRKLLILLAASALILTGCAKNFNDADIVKVKINGNKYELEVAQTDDAQRKGLSGREKLDKNKGVLFIYSQSDYPQFWMKDTLIPLQLLLIDNCAIVEIKEMPVEKDPANPEAIYKSSVKADKAIELNANSIPEDSIREKINELCD